MECQWVKIILDNQRNVIIGNLYRPPQGNVQHCIDYLENVIETFDLSKFDVFIMRDFNIDFSDRDSEACKGMKGMCTQTDMETCIHETTHFSNTKNSCIDQIITNSNFIANSGTADLNISDHQLVFLIRKKNRMKNEKTSFWGHEEQNFRMISALIMEISLFKKIT